MAESPSEGRIRDLKRRLELDPTSRLFVSLAEEYRKAGRFADALITLQLGLKNHPGYVSAQVALGRAYLEAGNVSEAIATFQKVLSGDPGNLVSAKSLADIYLSRGESVEAIKKYKLYRALSGDRTVDDIVERLEKEIAPPAPPRPSRAPVPSLPAPPTFFDAPTAAPTPRSSRVLEVAAPSPPGLVRRGEDILDVTSIKWEDSTSGHKGRAAASAAPEAPPPPPVPVPDLPTQPLKMDGASLAPPAEAAAPFPVEGETPEREEPEPEPFAAEAASPFLDSFPEAAEAPPASERPTDRLGQPAPPAAPKPPEPAEAPAEPQGRALADLYFAQGHYTEALQIYDELAAGSPFDAELKRLRRDAEARLLPAGVTPMAADPGLQRRLGKIRALKEWLSVVQAG